MHVNKVLFVKSSNSKQRLRILILKAACFLALFACAINQAAANEPSKWKHGDRKHLGVASCASSTCHGSTLPYEDSYVLRNEFRTWNEQDPHARAYATLLSGESKLIARKLGLKSAHTADVCLSCHADNVPGELRSDEFDIADGVGCETCHGGAGDYIESHTSGSHQENLAAGLVATEDPAIRGKLCVSCHIGNDSDRKITHTIMGAGHPRLSFELNTFSSIQPAHYTVDQDYKDRKDHHSELQIWAVGQLVAAEQLLKNVKSFPKSGLFPELVHMDCLGCHQPMSKVDWAPNPLTNLSAGSLRYNDAHLLMSYQLAKTVSPRLANQLLSNTQSFLNSGASSKKTAQLANALLDNIKEVRQSIQAKPLSQAQGTSILTALINNGLSASHQGYASAEQSAMAINSVVRVIIESSSASDKDKLVKGIDLMFRGVNNPEQYQADTFVRGLRQIRASI